VTLVLLGCGNSGVKGSSSILDQHAYPSALQAFRKDVLDVDCHALRATILAEIAPLQSWVSWLLDTNSNERAHFLKDRQIMSALVNRTSQDDCIVSLKLVTPGRNQDGWAFEQLVVQHWGARYLAGLKTSVDISSGYSKDLDRNLVLSLFENSLTVQKDRRACELLLDQVDPNVFPASIQYCRTLAADDVRRMFLSWRSRPKAGKKDDFKACLAQACLSLAKLLPDSMPSDIALAAAWHELVDPRPWSAHKRVAEALKELPSEMWGQGTPWSQLGPAAREAWRQDLFDQVRDNQELAHGLLAFCCLWLPQVAFAEVEPVLLRLMVDQDLLVFAKHLVSTGPRQVQLRVNGLMRQSLGALDFEGPLDQGEDSSTLPGIGAKTWLCDPSLERVIHKALSQMEDVYCREYLGTWGEDEEVHTARLLALTQEAVLQGERTVTSAQCYDAGQLSKPIGARSSARQAGGRGHHPCRGSPWSGYSISDSYRGRWQNGDPASHPRAGEKALRQGVGKWLQIDDKHRLGTMRRLAQAVRARLLPFRDSALTSLGVMGRSSPPRWEFDPTEHEQNFRRGLAGSGC